MTVRARAINKLHKGGFHMIATIATIAEKEVQRSLRSYGNHFSAIVAIAAIVATTIAEIDFSSISAMVAIVAIIWKAPFIDRIAIAAILSMVNTPEYTASMHYKMVANSVAGLMEEEKLYNCLHNKFSKDVQE